MLSTTPHNGLTKTFTVMETTLEETIPTLASIGTPTALTGW